MVTDKSPEEMVAGQRWKEELSQAKRYLEPWHNTAKDILRRLKDVRSKDSQVRRVNLATAEYLTKRAVLYGKTPQVSVSRRFHDAGDDVARVAGEMLGRHLNDEITDGSDGYCRALGYALEDRLSVGLGQARVRYESDIQPQVDERGEPMLGEDGKPLELKVSEAAPVDYVFWGDFLYSPCKYWEVVRWVAFKAEMSRKALLKRFGAVAASVPLDVTSPNRKEGEPEPPWGRATVWEIWDKEDRQVVWVTDGGQVLETRPDFLGLKSFFPCPRPLFALVMTDDMVPRPDYVLAEDLYTDIDVLATRMHLLRTALRVIGMYDAGNTELGELLSDTSENRMVPVQNWALFGEKGGLRGSVDFFPVQEVAAALVALGNEYEALKQRLYEVTGMSDILRGQGSAVATTYGEQRIKAQFGSARLQAVQDEFARFATELQALKREVIARHFDVATIIKGSNIERTPDAALGQEAAALLKSDADSFRVRILPEALALADFAQVKEERLEVIQAVAQYVAAITPLTQAMPGSMPALLEALRWMVSALRGSSEIEGVLDRAISMAQQAAAQPQQGQPQQPDPKLVAQQMKGAQELAKIQEESKARLTEIRAEVVADEQREANQMRYNVQEAALKTNISAANRAQGDAQRGL
jgi:hypothetical protein